MANEMRLIDANALKDRMGEAHFRGYGDAIMMVMDAPTVDAAPVVHGRWENPYINRYGHPCHCCSICGHKASYQDKNYCPNCGAKTDGA